MKRFSIEGLRCGLNTQRVEAQDMLKRLLVAEAHAIALTKLFDEHAYFSVAEFERNLGAQRLPEIKLDLLAVYLAGYLAAEAYESHFDEEVFGGGMSGLRDEKTQPVHAALRALLALVEEKGVVALPHRGDLEVKPSRKQGATKKAGKKAAGKKPPANRKKST